MNTAPDILCIGSVLWDVIGRSPAHMRVGSDVPGRITRIPGGVALNIAMTLQRFGLQPALLTMIGRDSEGEELINSCHAMQLLTEYVYRSDDLRTDIYMAVEGGNGLVAAIADAHSLEAAGDKILQPLEDGRLGSETDPYDGMIALDGNLTQSLLAEIAQSPLFSKSDLRVAPASPGKAERLLPFLTDSKATLYVNVEEASYLCKEQFKDAETAALGLQARGAYRAIITNGAEMAAESFEDELISAMPPEVMVTRVTGAGDTFMAAHIAAESRGESRQSALQAALKAAASYVSGEVPN